MTAAAVVAAYQVAYGKIRRRTVEQLAAAWQRAGGLTDADLEAFLRLSLPIAAGAEAATVAVVDAYIATLTKAKPIGLDRKQLTGAALRGTDPAEVFARPVIEARAAVSTGSTFDEAMAKGLIRATGLGETNVVLAQRAAIDQVVERSAVVTGYRRVLTGASCALCASASTRTYNSSLTMPIHQHCDCGIAPIFGTDPGAEANQRLLADMAERGPQYWTERGFGVEADGTVFERTDPLGTSIEGSDDEWRNRRPVQVAVHRHGELGPVLTPRGQEFTGPADI